MKNIFPIVIVVILLALAGWFFLDSYTNSERQSDDSEQEEQTTYMTQEQRKEFVSSYIETNISNLSPEPAVLGGTFYVTNIEFSDRNSGTVEYEDGHIALVADFTYSVSGEEAVEVEFSNVRENQP